MAPLAAINPKPTRSPSRVAHREENGSFDAQACSGFARFLFSVRRFFNLRRRYRYIIWMTFLQIP